MAFSNTLVFTAVAILIIFLYWFIKDDTLIDPNLWKQVTATAEGLRVGSATADGSTATATLTGKEL